MTKIKGSAMMAIPEFIKKNFGEEKYKEWLETLSDEAKVLYSKIILPSAWENIEPGYNEPLKKMCEFFYEGDKKGAFESGKYSAEKSLNNIYKFFLKLGSPGFILKKSSTIISTYYQPAKGEALNLTNNSCTIRMTDLESDFGELAGERIRGWTHRALELSGAKNVQVNITAAVWKGDDHVDFEVTWE